MPVTAMDVDAIGGLVGELCGVCLDHSKSYLLESRLSPLLKSTGFTDYAELAHRARSSPALATQIVDAMTTNETLFFRDGSPFQVLQHKVLPDLIDAKASSSRPRQIRIWSAGCSTGQEAYSIAITLAELIPDVHLWDITLLGSDVSDQAVSQASRGVFSPWQIQRGLSAGHVERYFDPVGQDFRIKDSIRALVAFERRNMLRPFDELGPFDIVFCRNVAIYFTEDARQDLFQRIAACMTPAGYLITGASESLHDLGERFAPHLHCRARYYRPNLGMVERPSAAVRT